MKSNVKYKRNTKSAIWRKRQTVGFSRTIRVDNRGLLKFSGWNEEQFTSIVYWVLNTYFTGLASDAKVSEFLTKLLTMFRTRGAKSTADYYKASRLAVTRFITNKPLEATDVPGVGLDANSLPHVLPSEWRDSIRAGNPDYIRLSLTMLSLTRAILGDPLAFSIDTIQQPSKYDKPLAEEFKDFLRVYLRKNAELFPRFIPRNLLNQPFSYHWTSKKGPNGPAIVAAYWDFVQLTDCMKDHMCALDPRLKGPLAGLQIVRDRPRMHKMLVDTFGNFKTSLLRKLSVKADKEAKSRVFGLVDYWSQQSLLPLHKHLFKILKSLPSDFTFDQKSGVSYLAAMKGPYDSLDLSAATDRFPIELQESVLEILSSDGVAQGWKYLLTAIPFHHPLVKHPIYYRAGQPMGALSSWAMFSLTHHLVVAFAAARRGKSENFDRYAILGDDIVIADPEVSEEYKFLMGKWDIPISMSKTHSSEDAFEFAKRWYKGVEITPFPLAGFCSVLHRWHLTYQFLKEAEGKGFPLPPLQGPRSFESLYWALYHHKERFVRYLVQRTAMIDAIPRSGDSLEAMIQKLKGVLTVFSVPGEWTIGPDKAAEFFSVAGSRALGNTIARDSTRLAIAAGAWDKSLAQAEKAMALWADQTLLSLPSWRDIVPVLGALDTKLSEADERNIRVAITESMYATSYFVYHTDSGDRMSFPIYPLEKLTELIKELEVAVIPKMNGVLPVRRSEAITGAQAMFAIQYFRVLTELLGLKDFNLGKPTAYDIDKVRSYFEIQQAIDKKVSQDMVIPETTITLQDPAEESFSSEEKGPQ